MGKAFRSSRPHHGFWVVVLVASMVMTLSWDADDNPLTDNSPPITAVAEAERPGTRGERSVGVVAVARSKKVPVALRRLIHCLPRPVLPRWAQTATAGRGP